MSACENNNFSPIKFQVTFVYNNGMMNSQVQVAAGNAVPTPSDPRKTNYFFRGWYTDSYLNNKYDFSKPVLKNITLYAKYEIDAKEITNKISTDYIRGIVKIYNKSYNEFLFIETSSSTSQGSGFCFRVNNGYYYILTNCHVAKKNSSYDKQKFTIVDYQGKQYEGHLYKNSKKSSSAIAASYDLACLYFKPSSTNVKALTLAAKDPKIQEDLISIGAPHGQSNSVTFGKLLKYSQITLTNTPKSQSNVTFDVIWHNAASDSGSSGGPILNANLEVVGVEYAQSLTTTDEFAIPAEKVREFLNNYFYS